MRATLFALPLLLMASSAAAETPSPETIQLPPELTDPQWADRLTDAMAAMFSGKIKSVIMEEAKKVLS